MLNIFHTLSCRVKIWARQLKHHIATVYYAARDPRTPWLAKTISLVTVAYALSPIDLIPDFIPILGFLDDVLLVPLGIYLSLKLLPEPILQDARKQAQALSYQPKSYVAASIIFFLWMLLAYWVIMKMIQ